MASSPSFQATQARLTPPGKRQRQQGRASIRGLAPTLLRWQRTPTGTTPLATLRQPAASRAVARILPNKSW